MLLAIDDCCAAVPDDKYDSNLQDGSSTTLLQDCSLQADVLLETSPDLRQLFLIHPPMLVGAPQKRLL